MQSNISPNADTHAPTLTPRPLWPWQKRAYDFCQPRDRVGIMMDKRLGKIAVASRWAAIARKAAKILVVAPMSACPGWLSDLETDGFLSTMLHPSFGGDRIEQLISFNESIDSNPDLGIAFPRFNVVNPQGLYIPAKRSSKSSPQPTPLALLPWDCIIWDESTNLKNPDSQINHIAHTHLQPPLRAILSGEPAPEGPLDLFEQMRWCFGFWMGHTLFWRWRSEHFQPSGWGGYEWAPKLGHIKQIKDSFNSKCFVLSRKDAGVNHQPPFFETRWIELPPKIRKVYDNAELNFELPTSISISIGHTDVDSSHLTPIDHTEVETKFAVVVDNWLAQLCGGYPKDFPNLHSNHKLSVLIDLLQNEYRNQQIVVAFRFNSELNAAAAALAAKNRVFSVLTGAVSPQQRKDAQMSFSKGTTEIILGQSRVLQFGIDLSAARTMIRYSLPPAYEVVSQSMDRIIHATKTDRTAYIDLVVKDTVDEDQLQARGDKKINARYFLDIQRFNRQRLQEKRGQ